MDSAPKRRRRGRSRRQRQVACVIPDRDVRAIVMAAQGKSASSIAGTLGASVHSVRRSLHRYNVALLQKKPGQEGMTIVVDSKAAEVIRNFASGQDFGEIPHVVELLVEACTRDVTILRDLLLPCPSVMLSLP